MIRLCVTYFLLGVALRTFMEMQEGDLNADYQVLRRKSYIHALVSTSCQLLAVGFIFPERAAQRIGVTQLSSYSDPVCQRESH